MDAVFVLAQPEDAEVLSELRRRVWATTYRGIYPDEMIDDFDYAFHHARNRAYIASDCFAVYLIKDGGEPIGYLILKKGNPLHLQSLYLLKAYRGQGIGRAAFDLVRQYCRNDGIEKFDLDCHPDNTGALAFYARMGGAIVSRDEGHERNEENGVRIVFSL